MRVFAFLVVCFSPFMTLADELPALSAESDKVDIAKELEALGSMDGEWVGMFKSLHDPNGANRNEPSGFMMRVIINGEDASLAFIEEGNKIEPFGGNEWLVFAQGGTALINYVAGNGAFTEIWTVSLGQIAPSKLRGYISRTVHNVGLRRDSPWRQFPVYGSIELERVE